MFRLSLFFYLFISLFYAKNDFNHKYFIKVDNFSSGSDYIVEGQRLLIIGAGISFNYNYEKAKQVADILSDEQIEGLRKKLFKGGLKNDSWY